MKKDFAYGVDFGWLSQLESEGYYWVDDDGNRADPYELVKELGTDSVRLRAFVNPPKNGYWAKPKVEFDDSEIRLNDASKYLSDDDKTDDQTSADSNIQCECRLGFCDMESVAEDAARVTRAGMRLMLDIHYSDQFADPQFQIIPEAWKDLNDDQLVRQVYDYTVDLLKLIKSKGAVPEWVQVGNEINPGLMLPRGDMKQDPDMTVRLLNSGYDAVKSVFPDTCVFIHLANMTLIDEIDTWFDSFFAHGGKADAIGLSDYPYWVGKEHYDHPQEYFLDHYYRRYNKPVIIAEIGEDEKNPKGSHALIADAVRALKSIEDGNGLGVFYWEPEACSEVLPDGYPLGAAEKAGDKAIHFTRALAAYRDTKEYHGDVPQKVLEDHQWMISS